MQFKHPEILYFLFFLLVPLLIHLFQLRRFKTEYFTNVRFLQQLSVESRKSSKIKKRLLLASRLLLLFFLILAFAQPFWEDPTRSKTTKELYIILDNSFSMQAKGNRGELLQRAIQDLLENTPANATFSLLTNETAFWHTDKASIQKELQQLPYSATAFDSQLQLQKIYATHRTAPKDILIITDGLEPAVSKWMPLPKEDQVFWIQPEAEHTKNISIDSVFVAPTSEDFYDLTVQLQGYGQDQSPVAVAIYNENQLVAQSMIRMDAPKKAVHFTLRQQPFHGYAKLTHTGLPYDDTYYFSLANKPKTRVLCLGTAQKNEFLSRIFTADAFQMVSSELKTLDYNLIEQQNTVVLNELDVLPQALQTTLLSFVTKGGNLIVIPSLAPPLESMNGFLKRFGQLQLLPMAPQSKPISTIHFNHPLFKGVFERSVRNFEYPKTEQGFALNSRYPSVLSYDDESVFLTALSKSNGRVYVFAAPINTVNSNFQQSPLIVPVFYQMGIDKQTTAMRAITIGDDRPYWVPAALDQSGVLQVKGSTESFIPLQQLADGKVRCHFGALPKQAGNYSIYHKNKALDRLSFNYARTESDLTTRPIAVPSHFKTENSIKTVFQTLETDTTDSYLWKWFLIFALAFLLIEMAIIRFVK